MLRTIRFSSFISKTAVLALVVGSGNIIAKEGMWLPPLIKQREADMKKMGLQIPVEKLYNDDGTGLNNAVVLFGKGCTGEVISRKGLVLTNHHCGYGTVQGLSSKEKDYFANGFWAMNMQEELPCPGLTVSFIRKMENVTDKILGGLDDTLSGGSRDSIIAVRIKNLEKGYQYATKLDATIKPYYHGNQYWITLSETFRDVRLVGFPPNGVGAFGGDTDNWMWPRHTGDFSIFRVYASKDNKPADYSKDNVAYNPQQFFTINANGYKEGDFTMVYGFPGTTMEYISSYQLNHVSNIVDPVRIEARTKRLNAWAENMQASRDVFIKYTSKRASVANGWKKWQGEVRGLQLNNVLAKKQAYEKTFQGWANTDTEMPYVDDLLSQIGARSIAADNLIKQNEYINEAVLAVELIQQASVLDKMLNLYRSRIRGQALQDTLQKIANATAGFYKNYDAPTDKKVFTVLMPLYFEKCSTCVPPTFSQQYSEQGSNYETWANYVFRSMATAQDNLKNLAASASPDDSMKVLADPAWQLYRAITDHKQRRILPGLNNYYSNMAYLNRLYMKGQMALDNDREFYPDANLTLRLTYGKIDGIDPDGPAGYSFQTNLDEAVTKANPSVEEFNMPQKLIDIHRRKDYGKWAVNGTVPVGFIASNHTSGGNSGSPVLNAKGELIGTNFDRIWEGTMSDLYFDPRICRNISVDIRYTLFIIEKLGGAGWLLKEMKLAK